MKKNQIILVWLFVLLVVLSACGEFETDYEAFTAEEDDPVALVPPVIEAAHTPEIATLPTNFQRDLSAFIEEIMAEDQLPGAAVAVIAGDEIIFAKGFGYRDVAAAQPVTPETLFHIGSTHKSITGLLIATLVDQGLFTWDTPIVEIYPEFELSTPESTRSVTLRHLLRMESGIPDTAEDDVDLDFASAEDLFDYIGGVPLLGAPGDEFSYSNISAALAGYIGVIAADIDAPDLYSGYEKLLRTQVLNPIGMPAAVLRVSAAEANPHYGKSYFLDDGEVVEAQSEDFDGDPLAPSGGLKVNLMEMAAYIQTQLNYGVAPNGQRVVSEANLLATWQPNQDDYAMGWDVVDERGVQIIMHEGAFDNYLSVIGFAPELELGFVILTNAEDAGERLIATCPPYLIDQLHFER